MRLATVEQSKEIDDISQKAYGLTGEILMESAGALHGELTSTPDSAMGMLPLSS